MHHINISEAEHTLPKLIQDVQNGEEIIITQNEKPVAKLISIAETDIQSYNKIIPGSAKGLIKIADDFDEPLEDFKEYM